MPLIVIVLGVPSIFFGLPMFMEDAPGPCAALEARVVTDLDASRQPSGGPSLASLVEQVVAGVSRGQIAASIVKNHYPRLPPTVGCAAVYWQDVLAPRSAGPRQAGVLTPGMAPPASLPLLRVAPPMRSDEAPSMPPH